MYPVSADFHNLSIADAPTSRVRIYFIEANVDCTDDNDVQTNGTLLCMPGETDSNGRIEKGGVTINEFFNSDANVQIGATVSSQIGMTLINRDGALDGFNYGRCKLYIDVYDDTNSTWLTCPMGVYNIAIPKRRKVQLVSATGYDQMQQLDEIADSWWNGLDWSNGITLLQIIQSMAATLGIHLSANTSANIVNSGLSYTEIPFTSIEMTYRDILSYIAETTGTIARFDRNGALDLRWFSDAVLSTDTQTYAGGLVTFTATNRASISSLSVPFSPIQDLHGYSSPWIGTDYDQQPYNFRAVSSSSVSPLGNSEMGNIVGGTVAWNQLVENGNFASTTGWVAIMGSISVANNELTYTVSKIGVHYFDNQLRTSVSPYAYNIPKDHVLLLSCETYAPYSNGFYMSARTNQIGQGGVGISNVTLTPNVWNKVSKIAKLNNTLTDIAFYWSMNTTYQVGDSVKLRNVIIVDLTAMFGSTIADYIYGLEQNTAGAGVAWFRKLFPRPYYAYNPGELMSVQAAAHKMVGFNAWDEEWQTYGTAQIKAKNRIPVIAGATYYAKCGTQGLSLYFFESADGPYVASASPNNSTFTVPQNCHFMMLYTNIGYGNTYNHDICINLHWDGERDGEYEPYEEHTYALDSSLTLRGIPKLDASNNLYYDGDVYESSGTVTRKYGTITLDGVTSGKKFTGTWGTGSSNPYGYTVYITFVRTKTSNVRCDKFVYSSRDRDNMPLYSFVGGSGVADTWTFVLPSTITSLAEANTWLSNNPTTIVYELATPTTETATAYAATQSIDPDGTEEYVDYAESQGTRDVAIPVGHYTNYANICPISGRTGISVWNDPKYGGTIEWNQQLYFDSFSWTKNGMQCSVNNGRFTLAGTATRTGTTALVPSFIYNKTKPIQGHVYALIVSGDTNLNYLRFTVYGTPNQTISLNTIQSVIFTCNSANSTDAEFVAQYNVGEEYSADITSYLCDLTLAFGAGNEPTTVDAFKALFYKDYYPYNAGTTTCVSAVNGDTYWKKDIDWTTPAGTVYGGTLDVVTGVLTVDWAMVTYDGSEAWAVNASTKPWLFVVTAPNDLKQGNALSLYVKKSNMFNPNVEIWDRSSYGMLNNYTSIHVGYPDANGDVNVFKSFLSSNPLQIVYELATPLTYQLTPQEVEALVGTNNVWSTGDSVSVTVAEPNLVEIQTDTVGNQCLSIDVGEYQVSQIDALSVKASQADVGVTIGSGGNAYTILDNPMLFGDEAAIMTKATPIYNRLSAFRLFTPISMRCIMDWSIEAGDIITVTNESVTYDLPIFQQRLCWRGGYVVSDLFSSGEQERPTQSKEIRSSFRSNTQMHEFEVTLEQLRSYIQSVDGNYTLIQQTVDAITQTVANQNVTIQNILDPTGEIWTAITKNTSNLSSIEDSLNNEITERKSYIRFIPSEPAIVMGVDEDNEIKLKLVNNIIYFFNGADDSTDLSLAYAYFNSQEAFADRFVAGESVQIGTNDNAAHWLWKKLNNGDLVLELVG